MGVRYTWKRERPVRWTGTIIYALRVNGKDPKPWLAKIQAADNGLWFWYGSGRNTSSTPATLDECKHEALEHIRSVNASKEPAPVKSP